MEESHSAIECDDDVEMSEELDNDKAPETNDYTLNVETIESIRICCSNMLLPHMVFKETRARNIRKETEKMNCIVQVLSREARRLATLIFLIL